MSFSSQVSRALDDEHRVNLDLLGRIEQALARAGRSGLAGDAEFVRLAGQFCHAIENDIGRHFDFEERELFPRLAEAGDTGITELLTEEHEAIRAVAAEVLPLARQAAAGSLAAAAANALKPLALEMVERMVAHIQKETMALLPMLEDLLDADTDRELAMAYAST